MIWKWLNTYSPIEMLRELDSLGEMLRLRAASGLTISVSAVARPTSVQIVIPPIWFQDDVVAASSSLEALGMRAEIVADRGGANCTQKVVDPPTCTSHLSRCSVEGSWHMKTLIHPHRALWALALRPRWWMRLTFGSAVLSARMSGSVASKPAFMGITARSDPGLGTLHAETYGRRGRIRAHSPREMHIPA